MIVVENLSKTFKKEEKEKGLRGSLKSLFSPNIKEVKARGAYVIYVTNEAPQEKFYDEIIIIKKRKE